VTVGRLIDSLASENDQLWPRDRWPAMRFAKELCVGASGGHGPVRYFVEAYQPGRSVRFRFTHPSGFDGFHGYELQESGSAETVLRHVLKINLTGSARFGWPLLFRPLHDALIEDSLERASAFVGASSADRGWSTRVRLLRWVLRRVGRRSR
jgi:hypothetical protein